jgi:hypothetical protein
MTFPDIAQGESPKRIIHNRLCYLYGSATSLAAQMILSDLQDAGYIHKEGGKISEVGTGSETSPVRDDVLMVDALFGVLPADEVEVEKGAWERLRPLLFRPARPADASEAEHSSPSPADVISDARNVFIEGYILGWGDIVTQDVMVMAMKAWDASESRAQVEAVAQPPELLDGARLVRFHFRENVDDGGSYFDVVDGDPIHGSVIFTCRKCSLASDVADLLNRFGGANHA